MSSQFAIEGASRLARTLRKAGADMKELRESNKAAAQVVVPPAKSAAPKKRGRLAASVRAGGTQKAGIIRAGSKAVPYAPVQEFGWPAHHIRPHLFVTTAAHNTEPKWTKVYLDHITKTLNKIQGE